MSDRTFPSLPGVVQVGREPFFVNRTQEADSGTRFVIKKRSAVGYRYTLDVRFLRSSLNEDRDLFDFFTSHGGSFESFLYTDAHDSVTRRVRFTSDDLDLRREPGFYTGEIELETVVD